MLLWRRIHSGYYVASADGSDADLPYGGEVYVVRTTPALEARLPDMPWRAETPDGYILAEGLSFRSAKALCERDVQAESEVR